MGVVGFTAIFLKKRREKEHENCNISKGIDGESK
jgi:hypothetical protein